MAAQGPTTATPAVMTSTSRLTQMQMRFQQRQQQERDQRKVEMVSATKTVTATSGSSTSSNRTIHSSATAIHHSVTTSSSSTATAAIQQDLSASLGAGKVRQMFEQRKAAGIDKSYPLQPIGQVVSGGKNGASNGSTAAPSKVAAANGLNNKTRVPPISANTKARLARQQQQHHQQENGNGEVLSKSGGAFDDNENLLEDEKFPDTISFDEEFALPTGTPLARKLPNVGKITTPSSVTNGNTVPAQNVNSLKLKPVPGRTPTTSSLKATPAAAPKKTPPATVATPSANPSSPRGSQPSSAKSRASTGRSGTSGAGSRKSSAVSVASASVASASVASVDSGPVPDGMARCSVCGRNFAEDRVAKHMEICRKTKSKKRKVFDVTKHRVQGTDAEKYVLRKGKAASSGSKKSISGPAAPAAGATSGGKGDWRRKHEEFIAAIRAAKEMKAYLAKGGKLSDLPPPPPSENPDYVQCPHCSRRFNQTAAERHIPKCATMLHNKPKPAAKRRV